MKTKYILFGLAFLLSPLSAHAVIIITPPLPTFENLQNLVFSAQTNASVSSVASGTPFTDQGTITLPLKVPVSVSYNLTHGSLWPNGNVSSTTEDALFTKIISENQVFIDLWEGAPFTPSARVIQTWDITNAPVGQITATFPDAGPYFFVAYLPEGFYQDPQAMCPGDSNWKKDCAPAYTLDQMRGYFNTSLASTSSEFFPYQPDAFGGTQFSVNSSISQSHSSNVLFLPGIEGSRLYTRNAFGVEENVWEPTLINNVSNLALNPDGSSQHEIYTRDLVDYPYGLKALGDVYGPFETFMDKLVSDGVIRKWEAFPYDWRYDVTDIVRNGSLVATPTGPIERIYLQSMLQELASTSPSGKVTIIAHSNGGLLAKALAIELQKENKLNLVNQIIFVGSPQIGTPFSIGALLNGDGQTDSAGGLLLYGGTVRAAASTMPGMYGLLPSAIYFSRVTNAPVLFPTTAPANLYEEYFGSQINSPSALENFLSDVPHVDANFPAEDLRTPLTLSDALLKKAADTHAQIDAWIPPTGITVSEINGWGNLTPYQYTYSNSNQKSLNCFKIGFLATSCTYSYRVKHAVANTDDGDNTVVSGSALGPGTDFYFNAKKYASDSKIIIGHSNLTSATPIQTIIKDLLTHTTAKTPYISSSAPSGGLSPLTIISTHSPVNIIATDASGNQTGIFPIPGKQSIYIQKEEIPGSSVQVLDDEKYLYLPPSAKYSISLAGYEDGDTTLDIGTMNASGTTNTIEEFSHIPTTPSTTATFVINPIQATASSSVASPPLSELSVDIFGDGSTTEIRASMPTNSSTSPTQTIMSSDTIIQLIQKELLITDPILAILFKSVSWGNFFDNQAHHGNTDALIIFLEKSVEAQAGKELSVGQANFLLQLLSELDANVLANQK